MPSRPEQEGTEGHEATVAKEDELEVCTNYRYARRHNPAFQPKTEEKPEEPVQKKAAPKKSTIKPRKPVKEVKKDPAQMAAEAKAAEEAEEAARALYKPKDYSQEEKDAWKTYADELHNWFGEIVLRQMHPAEASKPEGEGEKEPIQYGKRILREQNIQYDFAFLCEEICTVVPEPLWPDPDKEPLPPPLINSILRKLPQRNEREPITKFSIWTPIPADQLPPPAEGEEAAAP